MADYGSSDHHQHQRPERVPGGDQPAVTGPSRGDQRHDVPVRRDLLIAGLTDATPSGGAGTWRCPGPVVRYARRSGEREHGRTRRGLRAPAGLGARQAGVLLALERRHLVGPGRHPHLHAGGPARRCSTSSQPQLLVPAEARSQGLTVSVTASKPGFAPATATSAADAGPDRAVPNRQDPADPGRGAGRQRPEAVRQGLPEAGQGRVRVAAEREADRRCPWQDLHARGRGNFGSLDRRVVVRCSSPDYETVQEEDSCPTCRRSRTDARSTRAMAPHEAPKPTGPFLASDMA